VKLFGRSEPPPRIYGGEEIGTINEGLAIDVGRERGEIGSFQMGRPAKPKEIALARRFYLEIDAGDLERHGDYLVDRGNDDGRLYSALTSDPLLAPDPTGQCDCFTVFDGAIVFLRQTEVTLAELERTRLERERAVAKKADDVRRFRSKQKQHGLTLADLPGGEETLTLKRAAQTIEELGGRIGRDELGQLVCSIPQKLWPDSGVGHSGLLEREHRQLAARSAEILSRGRAVVFAALEQASKEQPLSTLLPDETALV
jgi:hypothetical protein